MLRFAFKPRHPVTRVAFTADGREVVTAQPFTSIAVRDRLTGVARVTIPMPRATVVHELVVNTKFGFVVTLTNRGATFLDESQDAHLANELDRFWTAWHLASSERAHIARYRSTHLKPMGVMALPSTDCGVSLWLRDSEYPYIRATDGPTIAVLDSRLRGDHFVWATGVIAFSPDGGKVALGDGESLSVFDFSAIVPRSYESGERRPLLRPLLTLERPDPHPHGTHADKLAEHWLPPVAFDHAGRSLFTLGLRNRVQRIDLATGGVMCEWGWRCEPIRSLAVSPDDLTAAAGCQRGELVLWDLE